ncbi:ferrous iron transport protein A [Dehalobacter sp. DCM]|uniref:FeoA family protein n=1 Tax=Dehalobacter sp. DCM TaxID=2907827 RepID=UPI0030815169|nr:ferrous iron transport protein A [Dehalobacter sp. DCM]
MLTNDQLTMDKIPVETKAKIVRINMDRLLKKKLTDMGLIAGTEFRVDGQAPLGDPIKISIRGYQLAIRRSDAKKIDVEKI